MSQPLLLHAPWPRPVPDGYGRAFDFHLTTCARWLRRSGAEPRLLVVLCSGRGARDRFVDGIGIDGVEVVLAPCRADQPVHRAIADHAGTHFNATLFVADGLEGAEPALFEALEGRRGLLTKAATWVALMVESLETLGSLYRYAPRLMADVMRRCLVLDARAAESKAAPLDADIRGRWRGAERVAEHIYHHAMTPGHGPSLTAFDRLARTGYLPALVGRVMHPERQRLCGLWSAGPDARALPFAAEQAGPAAAEAALRHAPHAVDDAARAVLAARLDDLGRLAAGVALPPGLLADLAAVEAMGRGEHPVERAVTKRLRAAVSGAPLDVAAHAHRALAAACAADGDLDGCSAALAEAVTVAEAAGLAEVAFDMLEKQVQLAVFADRLGEAKTVLQRLEALAPTLHSPFYAARARLARGEFSAPLDPARAALELQEAERLFRAHGHPEWARTAQEALP